jgi:hypothetical protein
MPALPIFFGDQERSLKAAMIFPSEPTRARICAAWLKLHDMEIARERGFDVSAVVQTHSANFFDLASAAADFAYLYSDAQQNAKDGARAGIVVTCLWALICGGWHAANLETAIEAAERYFAHRDTRLPATRTQFYSCLSRFRPVLHLLGARTLRRRSVETRSDGFDSIVDIKADSSTGYSRKVDVLFFATEARQLQVGLLAWNKNRSQPSNLLDEMFELNGPAWTPPPRQPGWPDTGQIKRVALDPWIKIVRGRPGRRKTLSK